MTDTAAIVLAAGASKRLGRPKQFVQLHGESLVRRAARLALESGAAPVYVVGNSAHLDHVRHALEGLAVTVLENQNAAEGMGSSLRCGIGAVRQAVPPAERVLLLVCDQPGLTAEGLRQLLAAAMTGSIAAAEYAGRCGVPAVFARRYFDALAAVKGDFGARELLRRLPVQTVPMPEAALDLDTPEDLAALLREPG